MEFRIGFAPGFGHSALDSGDCRLLAADDVPEPVECVHFGVVVGVVGFAVLVRDQTRARETGQMKQNIVRVISP